MSVAATYGVMAESTLVMTIFNVMLEVAAQDM